MNLGFKLFKIRNLFTVMAGVADAYITRLGRPVRDLGDLYWQAGGVVSGSMDRAQENTSLQYARYMPGSNFFSSGQFSENSTKKN